MPRIHSDPSPSGVTLAGPLAIALVSHTKERMRHFFLFLSTFRMLMHVLKSPAGDWPGFVRITATHQVDTGLRRDEGWDVRFDTKDVSVLDLNASAFKRVDAAHYCNLGLEPSLAALSTASTDERARFLYEALVSVCANTRLLPQRINIGPDRVVDKAHGDLCMAFLKEMAGGAAPISLVFFQRYKDHVVSRMKQYAADQATKGNAAVVEAAGVYVATLIESQAPQELRTQGATSRWINTRSTHTEEVWATLLGNAWGDLEGYGFNREPGLDLSMFISRKVF